MSNKRELHTLFIKHDTDFKTLSKKALSEVILKIILFQNGKTGLIQIKSELSSVITGNVSDVMINDLLRMLIKDNKIVSRKEKYSIHPNILQKLQDSVNANKALQERIFSKYLNGGQTSSNILKPWFQDTLIRFFENYSLEWFNHLTQHGKLSPKKTDNNVSSAINEIIVRYGENLVPEDYPWLKSQFIKFYESEEYDENMMFWNFGMSLFSSRLITAGHYADKISIDTYKNGCFLLDTNILMILNLEGHESNQSFNSLDKIFNRLNIKTKILNITKEEYKRAIAAKKEEIIHIFESFDLEVLKTTKCPFIQTALKRSCVKTEDIERMFDTLYDIPKSIFELTKIEIIDFSELEAEVQKGCENEELKTKINEIYFKRLKKYKRENPKTHDAGMISGVNYLRKTESTWILTTDGTIKLYAIENMIRDETEIAIGLDALIGLFAVNSGGVDIDSSDFAPLFKNLIKDSLIPEEDIFDVRDLSFILSTNLRINELGSSKVVEIANTVRKMRIAGTDDNEISLFLRREVEGQKLNIVNDLGQAKASESVAKAGKELAERERDLAYDIIREDRSGKLRDEYNKKLLFNRCLLICTPLIVSTIILLTLKYGLKSDQLTQYIVDCGVGLIFSIIPLFPLNNRLVRKHSEYVQGINRIVENEIAEMKRKAKE